MGGETEFLDFEKQPILIIEHETMTCVEGGDERERERESVEDFVSIDNASNDDNNINSRERETNTRLTMNKLHLRVR